MRTLITMIALSLFTASLLGQNTSDYYLDDFDQNDNTGNYDLDDVYGASYTNTHQEKDLTDFVYLLDSSYYFSIDDTGEWMVSRIIRTEAFDEYGNFSNVREQRYSEEQQQWDNSADITYSYYNATQRDVYHRRSWDKETLTWIDSAYYAKYNVDNQRLLLVSKRWDEENNNFRSGTKLHVPSFTPEGEINSEIIELWNVDDQKWNKFKERRYSYNGGFLMEFLGLRWNLETDVLENDFLRTYTYDDNGNKINELRQKFTDGEQLVNSSYYTFDYDENGKGIYQLFQIYTDTGELVNYRKLTRTCDDNGNETLYFAEKWNEDINEWENERKDESSYNSNAQLIERTTLLWINEEWVNIDQYLYEYDDNENRKRIFYQKWDINLNEWINEAKIEYYYSVHDVVAVNDLQNEQFRVFPNPSSNQLFIQKMSTSADKLKVTVYNATGQLVIKNQVLTNKELNVTTLTPGVYFLNIYNGKEVVVKKFIKE